MFHPKHRHGMKGFTLVELMVAITAAALLMALVMGLYIFGLRSFGAIGNYTSMDSSSRRALDLMLREVRQSSLVLGSQTNGPVRWLKIASSTPTASTNTFVWDTTTNGFTWTKTGSPTKTLLTGCTAWSFSYYLRSPSTLSGEFVKTPVTSQSKLINMSWTCARTNVFRVNTENIVTAQVVLRNLQVDK
jgi:prepilin-type N-terminal cleavage/methylation domain-containing protein